MPIYEYACKKCSHTLDALQKIAEPELVDCPSCGAPDLKRQLSAPRFRLKGKGWYETDFKKDNQRNLAGDKDPSKSKDESKSDKSDSDSSKSDSSKSDKSSKSDNSSKKSGDDKAKSKSSEPKSSTG